MRDTDADWTKWGEADPFFGVLSHDRLRRANLTPEALDEFWSGGVVEAAGFADVLTRFFGPFPRTTALDFGCGVGRLTRGMAAICDHVTGLDISPGMLVEARRSAPENVAYVSELEDQTFDWINSTIVFQHIPPERGYLILEDLLRRVNEDGAISLHFTISALPNDPDSPVGAMMMFSYDLTRIAMMLARYGIWLTLVAHTNHGGHEGVVIYGRRKASFKGIVADRRR